MIPPTLYIGVRPEHDEDHESFMRRLRAFLKAALRQYGIRCTDIRKAESVPVSVPEQNGTEAL